MAALNLPPNYQAVMPYLILKDAAGFITFAKDIFDATEQMRTMRDDQKIMHAEINIHGSTIMVAEQTDEYASQNAGIFVYVADCDSAYQRALDKGAESILPPADQSYGRSAGIKDPFGNTWWVTHPLS
ncbi:VOC family protein [Chitinophaga rhizophila]|uniref:VOC family protein n=1 Tax=Chitinophaga rhizophila TaxID=2866212 RepID=A0ABS7GBF6_9BACT|nr:VOC family protein [Chitinophaga rhizophila]MBW8683863.1 VOC family protein [Chitinophaga rhizophila]